ncbi:MAG TPA: radical SAM family heme chaperone HemW [Steroidobacteraceae bacterium]|nr:radical SAM family heme chaperone HemW [Steroidobacteraceae bacterium]
MISLPPLALYVHMPWCVRKCPYCDFNSHVAPESIPQQQYIDALIEDLAIDAAAAQGRALTSVFFGGGTPSLFAPDQVGRFLEAARAQVAFAPDAEITLEANPGTIEHGRFSGYRDAGINRVSLGAQTFDAAHLQTLGRIHGSGDIARAVEEVVRAGLDNFNLDLMYGLPAQTQQQALADLDAALALGPAHISHYQLTLEPGTVFYHRPPPLPDSDATWQMQLDCQERLAARGYEHYEVSAYARAGRRSRHNLNYWQFGDYIGVGAGAHGKLTWLANAQRTRSAIVRSARIKQPREFLRRAAAERISDRVPVETEELPFEYMLNVLRLTDDFAEADYEARTGLAFATVAAAVAEAERKGLLRRAGAARWRVTELGQRFLNDLQALFLPAGQVSRRASDGTGIA